MNQQQIKEFVLNNPKLVTMRQSTTYPELYVLKYAKHVFFKDLWNDELEECRGTVVDADFNIVSRPFTKIYNYGVESRSPVLAPDTPVDAYRKVNGFMFAVSLYQDELLVSTTGSLDSPFVEMAREMLEPYAARIKFALQHVPGYNFMFECVHPNDPHIVPEQCGIYLLGYRKNSWDSKVLFGPNMLWAIATYIGLKPVEYIRTTVGELQQLVREVKHEGFVFYTDDGVAAKIKSPYYLTLKAAARKQDIMSLDKRKVDEEYYPLLDYLQSLGDDFNKMPEQERLQFIISYLEM